SLVLLVVMLLPVGGHVRNIALVPLVLVLPGYAISVAMFGPGAVSRGERFVYTLALSVATAALGGLLWQLFFGLGRLAWAFLMVATVLVAARVARRRRLPRLSRPSRRSFRLGLPTALAMLASLVLAVVAVDTAVKGLHDQRAEANFSSLWVVPEGPSGDSVEIGVWNHQGDVHTYLLSVERGGAALWRWEGRLGSQKRAQVALDPTQIAGSGELRVSLYRDGVLYRRTELETGVGT
ncbi:MAG: hypothetical protein ACHQCI_01515, partial [Solirubrobacterales bacterium]